MLLLVAAPALAASAREMYSAAMARANTLRAGRGGSTATTSKRYRAAVAAFEAVVRRYPTSGYADNALWEGARLALEAYDRLGDERELQTAGKLLTWLIEEYASSPLVPRARSELKKSKTAQAKPSPAPTPAKPEARPRTLPPAKPEVKAAAPAAAAAPTNVLRDIRRTQVGDVVRVVLQLDAEVAYHSERVENPPRVLFDLPATRLGGAVGEGTVSYSGDVVRHIRVGRRPNQLTRVVLDLDGVVRYSVFTLYAPYRIVVDCERDRAAAQAVPTPAQSIAEEHILLPPPDPEPPLEASPLAAREMRSGAPLLPVVVAQPARIPGATAAAPNRASRPPAPVIAPRPLRPTRTFTPTRRAPAWLPVVRLPQPIPLPAPPIPTEAPSRARSETLPDTPRENETPAARPPAAASLPPAVPPNGFSLARQLGLGAARIVIDPGHGGHDPGAERGGLFESNIVLDVALRLEKLLHAAGIDVVLTRRTDTYVPLEERTAIANRSQGDLFLSIHANASRKRTARGVETYFLNFATNPEAEAVAARENAATGRTMSSLTDIVKAIALNNKLDESKNLAGLVQKEMVEHLKGSNPGLKNHGVKQAPFVVLIGASMPSVLVEVSFITHSQEGRLLKSGAYRQKIAEALFEAVRGYQKSLKATTAITNQ